MDTTINTISKKGELIGRDIWAVTRLTIISLAPSAALIFLQGLISLDYGNYTVFVGGILSIMIETLRRKYSTNIYVKQNS